VSQDRKAYAKSAMLQYEEQDYRNGQAVIQKCADRYLIQNPPSKPLEGKDLDDVYALPYTRAYHPSYEQEGGVPGLSEVEFSIIHNRGCFGACNFCSLAFHQGRYVTARSHESVIKEATAFGGNPRFKGYIHDVGGPTANFRHPACKKQAKSGVCKNKRCLFPTPCESLDPSHSDYLTLLRELKALPHVKKVFIRSGIRYDYMLCDKNSEFFSELVRDHISGQLKVAPEHKSGKVLYYMGKPSFDVYEKFQERYKRMNQRHKKEQYLVPYLMSSHPGSELSDAIELALQLKRYGYMPEQVQDFYPTPGTLSTAMYYTGIDPRTMKEVYVPRTPVEKAMQRALLQWGKRENRALVMKALKEAGREDLIGYTKDCLVRPDYGQTQRRPAQVKEKGTGKPKRRGRENKKWTGRS
ncbi:MAG: YgiQ family radical SAM protein, partial [Clostridiales bacterium]|nr:YgiQ family radical SAM protein [Clostridiales bacterium]